MSRSIIENLEQRLFLSVTMPEAPHGHAHADDGSSAIFAGASHEGKEVGELKKATQTATLQALPLTTAGATQYTFDVVYGGYARGDHGISAAQRVIVTGPQGFSAVAKRTAIDRSTNTVTYAIQAPDGTWSAADNGTYTVSLRMKNSQHHWRRALTTLGTFNVAIDVAPPPVVANEAPSFTAGPDQVVAQDSGATTVSGWATNISAGPASEAGQTLTFSATTSNDALFAAAPAIAADGTLTFTPAAGASGSAVVTVLLQDSGGTANGGVDTSAPQTFTITVDPAVPPVVVNQAPSFTAGPDQIVAQDSGATTVTGWATNISAGPASEVGQALTFSASTSNDALFAVKPTIAADGTLMFTPAAGASGSATVTVLLQDNGGTSNGGVDTSAPQTFTITVNPVAPAIPSLVGTYNGMLVIPAVGHNRSATLTIANQAADGTFTGTLVSSYVSLDVTGTVAADGTFTMSLTTPAGTLHPGGPLSGTGTGTIAAAGQPMAVSLLFNGSFDGTLTVTKA